MDYANDDPEGYDWETLPDIVEQYFGSGASAKAKKTFIIRYFDYDGRSTTETYEDYKRMAGNILKRRNRKKNERRKNAEKSLNDNKDNDHDGYFQRVHI